MENSAWVTQKKPPRIENGCQRLRRPIPAWTGPHPTIHKSEEFRMNAIPFARDQTALPPAPRITHDCQVEAAPRIRRGGACGLSRQCCLRGTIRNQLRKPKAAGRDAGPDHAGRHLSADAGARAGFEAE